MRVAVGVTMLASLAGFVGCDGSGTTLVHGTAVDHGRALFADPLASPTVGNVFACATCHADPEGARDDRLLPGGSLVGATARRVLWAGQENDLLRSINDCRFYFMRASRPWTADDEEARALYAWLTTFPGDGAPVPFTVVTAIADLPPGDPAVGAGVYTRACAHCHGAIHSGDGRLTDVAPKLPDETLAEHAQYSPTDRRLVFIEKVRHGGFLGYGGTMPPFSREVLSDESLAALLAYLDVYR